MLDVDIKKQLKGFTLDVAFSIGDELAAIFGPSGSGKSLTLQCIAGLIRPDSGMVSINGRPVFDASRDLHLRPQERRIGYVFQNYALLPHLSVAQNIAFGLHRLPRQERAGRVEKVVAAMRLEGLEYHRPSELSGGQQQRVAVARALVTEPDLLLLDEPFSALDSPIRSRLHGELLRLLQGLSITAVLVTHNLAEAYTLSEKMLVYDAGRVLQVGPRDEVLRRPASRTVARFTGAKNLFQGVVVRSLPDGLEVRAGDALLRVPPGPYPEGTDRRPVYSTRGSDADTSGPRFQGGRGGEPVRRPGIGRDRPRHQLHAAVQAGERSPWSGAGLRLADRDPGQRLLPPWRGYPQGVDGLPEEGGDPPHAGGD